LAVLAVNVGSAVPIAQLISEVWGKSANDKTGRALESNIWRLRKSLAGGVDADEVIATDSVGYRLIADRVRCDSTQFRALAGEVERALARSDLDAVLKGVERALALWSGDPFAGAASTPLIDAERLRLGEMRRHLLGRRGDIWIAQGHGRRAVHSADQLINEDGFNERWWALKIRALTAIGEHVRALASYTELRDLLGSELGIEPGYDIRDAHNAVLAAASGPAAVVRLPTRLSSFIGRDTDVTDLADRLTRARLITAVGPPGVGKTRLAIEAARRSGSRHAEGTFFVDLAEVERGQVAATIVSWLRLPPAPGLDVAGTLRAYLSPRTVWLLLDAVAVHHAPEIADILSSAPHVSILATGAHPLDIDGEQIVVVEPLATASSNDRPPPAVQLLIDRIRTTDPTFVPDDRRQLVRICRALDGLPLGIELAAARAMSFSLDEIADQLRTEVPAPITDALDNAYRLLTPTQARLHRALALLPGPFTAAAAQGVAPGPDTPGLLDALVRRSVLARHDRAAGRRRFRQLGAVRRHAHHHLSESEKADVAQRRRHWVLDLLADQPAMGAPGQKQWLDRIDNDYPTVLAVLRHSGSVPARHLASLSSYWYLRSRLFDGIAVLTSARGDGVGRPRFERFVLDTALATTYAYSQRMDQAQPLLEAWTDFDHSTLDPTDQVRAVAVLVECSLAVWVGDDHDRALAMATKTAVSAEHIGNPELLATARAVLAVTQLTAGHPAEAVAGAHQAFTDGGQNNNSVATFLATLTLGIAALFEQDSRAGLMWSRESLTQFLQMGGTQIGDHLEQRGMHHSVAANWDLAATLFGAGARYCTALGVQWPRHPFTTDTVERCRTELGARFDAAWNRGTLLAARAITDGTPDIFLDPGL
jgi:predicted ATPase/DNA-binding SARP family transcriptional activator